MTSTEELAQSKLMDCFDELDAAMQAAYAELVERGPPTNETETELRESALAEIQENRIFQEAFSGVHLNFLATLVLYWRALDSPKPTLGRP